jgi:hypothetical protein
VLHRPSELAAAEKKEQKEKTSFPFWEFRISLQRISHHLFRKISDSLGSGVR